MPPKPPRRSDSKKTKAAEAEEERLIREAMAQADKERAALARAKGPAEDEDMGDMPSEGATMTRVQVDREKEQRRKKMKEMLGSVVGSNGRIRADKLASMQSVAAKEFGGVSTEKILKSNKFKKLVGNSRVRKTEEKVEEVRGMQGLTAASSLE
jgi:hypothetical protein